MAKVNSDPKPAPSVHPSSRLGPGCSVGAGSIIGAGVTAGRECVIGDYVILEGAIAAGDDVFIGSHSCLEGAIRLAARTRIGAQCSIQGSAERPTEIREGAILGPHSTVQPGVIIGEHAVLEAGAVVSRNVPACAVVAGNPARILRYVSTTPQPAAVYASNTETSVTPTSVSGVTLHRLPLIEDLRGTLSFGEVERHVPFSVKRYFLTFDVAGEEVRGEHAHHRLEQFLISVHGRLHIAADDGRNREEFILDRPNLGVYLPPMTWGVQYRFSPGAVLLGLCSDYYQPEDYIREYTDFLRLKSASR